MGLFKINVSFIMLSCLMFDVCFISIVIIILVNNKQNKNNIMYYFYTAKKQNI